jgi:2-polyprenyl-6-methoxyphenol hydroxylase-like FAD-dependent oxidoreductase
LNFFFLTKDEKKNSHGCSLYCFHRAELVQFLYDALSDDHDKIFSNKKLTEIITTTTTTAQGNNNSVKVTCADGSSYTGSIVLGADGVHSQTRVLMRKLALLQAQRDTDTDTDTAWENELAFPANYKCLFFSIAPTTPSTAGLFVDTESKDRCLFYMAGHQRGWVFLCETASKDGKSNNTTTPLDFASRFAEFPITKDTKVKDVFPDASTTSSSIGMTSLQEGLAGQWSWDRIVLAGDSCHKFTPHAGLGYNSGVQDVVVLVNVLQKTLGSKQQLQGGQEDVTTEQIAEAFRAYQDLRMPFAKADSFVSAAFARLQSWANWAFYIMARYVFPLWIWDYMLYNHVSPAGIKHAAILEHISAEEPFTGRIEWENKMQAK